MGGAGLLIPLLPFLAVPWLRAALALVLLPLVPGYLLVQAVEPRAPRPAHLALALGLGLPLVGLAALATALVPGGFRPMPILVAQAVLAAGLATVALVRRSHALRPTRQPA